MTIFYYSILIFILIGICIIYYYSYKNIVYEIIKNANNNISKNIDSIKDYIIIIKTIKNEKINKYEKGILITFLFFYFFSIILSLIFLGIFLSVLLSA